jgi:hypothetical protein
MNMQKKNMKKAEGTVETTIEATIEATAELEAKQPYVKPELVEYGDVREFTRGPGGSKNEKFGAGFS